MQILFVVPYAPNPIRVRPYEFLRALAARGHAITLAAPWVTESEASDLERLERLGIRVLTQPVPAWKSGMNCLAGVASSIPLQAVYSWQPTLMRMIDAALAGPAFDAVHVEHLRGSRYGLEILARLRGRMPRPPVIWDSVDCISHLFAQAARTSRSLKGRLMTRLELGRTQRYEAQLVQRFDHTLVTSRIDQEALVELATRYPAAAAPAATAQGASKAHDVRIEVVPNGVDLEHFRYHNGEGRAPNRIIFSGKLSYHANVTAAVHLLKDIMPAVWATLPETEVWLVGKDPAPELRALAQANCGPEQATPRVVVTGAVEDMPSYIRSATVSVAPLLYGAGIQNKVLEAMACGTAVVTSPQASQALAAQPGEELLVAGTPDSFAAAIRDLLQSPQRAAELGKRGRAFVERAHSWASAAATLESIYRGAAERTAKANGE